MITNPKLKKTTVNYDDVDANDVDDDHVYVDDSWYLYIYIIITIFTISTIITMIMKKYHYN